MCKKIITAALTACLLSLGTNAYSEQVAFSKRVYGAGTDFDVSWRDMFENIQQMSYRLPTGELDQGSREFQSYDEKDLRIHTFRELKKYAKTLENRNLKIEVKLLAGRLTYDISGTSDDMVKQTQSQLNYRVDKIQEDYLKERYYYSYKKDGQNYIMPDHVGIASRYVLAMRPLAREIEKNTAGKSQRDVLDYTLNFLQSIPYDRLESRITSNGAGFSTPYGLLRDNLGDCDSKSVAFAAIVKNLYPRLKMAIIYVPDHAFIGINLPKTSKDWAVRLGRETYVLAEPAGPALVPIGKVAEASLEKLRAADYNYREMSF